MTDKKQNRHRRLEGDSAVSPVIAVILMVAITVVLAATVYVWVSGFTDTGDQAPSANFRYVACDPGDTDETNLDSGWNNVTIRLTSGGPLQLDDSKAVLYNQTNDVQEAQTDPINSTGGQWATGSQVTIGDLNTVGGNDNVDADWDSSLSNGLDDGTSYRMDFVHKPTESTYASLPFTC